MLALGPDTISTRPPPLPRIRPAGPPPIPGARTVRTVEVTSVALAVANLLVLLEVLRHEWGYFAILLVYWCEGLIIGGFNVLRMLVAGLFGGQPLGARASETVEISTGFRIFATILGTGFFAYKFGLFALFVGAFVVMMPAFSAPAESGGMRVLEGLSAAAPGVAIATAGLLVSHGVSFVRHFIVGREYERANLFGLIVRPYLRMALVGAVLIGGLVLIALVPWLSSATVFSVVIVLAKLGADLFSHRREHAWAGSRTSR